MLRVAAALVCLILVSSVACTSSKERAQEAEAEYTEEKTKTLKEYKQCIKDAEGDEKKTAACEGLLRAVEAVEGSEK